MKTIMRFSLGMAVVLAIFFNGKVQANGSTNVLSVCDEASLRAAIGIGGWVSVTCNGTVTLSNTICITNNVILDASGVSFGISGGNAVRLFCVAPGASFFATNLTLANGSYIITNNSTGTNAYGGGIYNDGGTVTLVACTLTNNTVQSLIYGGVACGGAIFNNGGTLNLCRSSIADNLAIGGGPNDPLPLAIYTPSTGIGMGGAIYNTNGMVAVIGCNVVGNLCEGVPEQYNGEPPDPANAFAMGGALSQSSGSIVITNCCFGSNTVVGGPGRADGTSVAGWAYGGAVAVTGGGLAIDHSLFWINQALGGAAANGNTSSGGSGGLAYGGAVYCASGGTFTDSAFFGNRALAGSGDFKAASGCGGGIYNAGGLVLNRCSIYANDASGGVGAAFNGGDPSAGGDALGGGIFNAAQLALTNCTIAINSAAAGGGSGPNIYTAAFGNNGNALGGGIFSLSNATTIVMNVTIASNNCTAFGPGYGGTNGFEAGFQIANTNGTLSLHNTILAYSGTNGNAYGVITDAGYNLSSDATADLSGPGSLNNTDPLLGPLANYGGPTLCMALAYNSPAIGTGDSAGAPPTDQRGDPRPSGSGVDIGAYQFISNQLDVPRLTMLSVSNSVVLSFQGYSSGLYHLLNSSNLTSWIDLGTLGPYSGLTNVSLTISPNTRVGFYKLMLP